MSLNVAQGNCKVCNFLSTALKSSHCSVIQLKLFFSPIQMRAILPALPPDQRRGGLLSMYYSLWVVCHKETAKPHQKKYYSVPSLPSGPVTFSTANERNTFGLTQIMFLPGPTHKMTEGDTFFLLFTWFLFFPIPKKLLSQCSPSNFFKKTSIMIYNGNPIWESWEGMENSLHNHLKYLVLFIHSHFLCLSSLSFSFFFSFSEIHSF